MEVNGKKIFFISLIISIIISILFVAIVTYDNNEGLFLKDSIQTQAKVIEVGEVRNSSGYSRGSLVFYRRITYCYEGSDGKSYTGTDLLEVTLSDDAWYRKEAVGETIDISFHVDHPEKSIIGKPKHLFLIDDMEDFLFIILVDLSIFLPIVYCSLIMIREKREKNLKENDSILINPDSTVKKS